MCGIAGTFSYQAKAPNARSEELLAIRDHMNRRGPDGAGEWFSLDRRVGLAHRRLSIIDLSDRASQPMLSADGRLSVTFNGEIYNHRELREQLVAKGHVFRTTSDTEVLLHLYADRGEAMLTALRGMFAFAIWDSARGGLLLARDPYGIKPLYYADGGGTLRFASQVRALLAGGAVSRTLDPAGQVGFYLWGSVPEPFTSYEAIRALPAGASLWVDENGCAEPRTYFSIAKHWADACELNTAPRSAAGLQEEVSAALRDTVQHHLVADVPVSSFLSAGIDSGTLVGLMTELGAAGCHAITLAFTEFAGSHDDEVPLATQLARHYGVEHHIRYVDKQELVHDLPAILAAMDQPSIDGVNTWFVSKATAEIGLKVAVSGLGGDELFGGYGTFQDIPRIQRAMRWVAPLPALGRALRSVASRVLGAAPVGHPKLAGLAEYGGSMAGAYLLKRGLFMPWELPSLLPLDVVHEGLRRLAPVDRIDRLMQPHPRHPFAQVATLEACQYMRNQLLRDTDWASMAHSLEVRVPLVDHALLTRLAPLIVQSPQLDAKARLAESPRRPLPAEVRAHKKTGFSTPLARWLRELPELDAWRRVPALTKPDCPWARRYAYAVGSAVFSARAA